MNIIIIGSVRTKSTALAQYLTKLHPNHFYWGEPFYELTLRSNNPLIKNKEKFILSQISKILEKLFENKNNIIKILGINLYGIYKFIDDLNLSKFDLINLIERKDFFDQVCSIVVAKQTNNWHKTKTNYQFYDKTIQSNHLYTIDKNSILSTATDVYNYIMIKKWLVDNNISFVQYTYENLDDIHDISIIPNNVDYKQVISNYHMKIGINTLFYNHFNYDTMKADIENFSLELENLLF